MVAHRGYRRYVSLDGEAGIDWEKLKEDARFDDKWVLRTNTTLPADEVAKAYKGLGCWMRNPRPSMVIFYGISGQLQAGEVTVDGRATGRGLNYRAALSQAAESSARGGHSQVDVVVRLLVVPGNQRPARFSLFDCQTPAQHSSGFSYCGRSNLVHSSRR